MADKDKEEEKKMSDKDKTQAEQKKPELNATEQQVEAFVDALHQAGEFTVTRYPYLCAVFLMMLIPEQLKEDNNKKSDINFNFVYAQLGFYFTVGTLMSFNILGMKRVAAFFMAAQCCFTAYFELGMKHKQVILARILFRNLGCFGAYLMIAGGLGRAGYTEPSSRLLKLGRQIMGAYVVLMAVLLMNNKREFAINSYLLPGGWVTCYLLIGCYFLCGISIDYGLLVVNVSKVVMMTLFVVTLVVDMNEVVWLKYGGIKKWRMYTIAAYHVPITGALMLFRPGFF